MSLEKRIQVLEKSLRLSKSVNELPNLTNISGNELLALYSPSAPGLTQTPISNILSCNEFRGRLITADISATDLKQYKYGFLRVTQDIKIDIDDSLNNDFNVIIHVTNGATVTITTSNTTVDDTNITDGQIAILYKQNQVNEFYNTLLFDANQAGGGGIVDSYFSDRSTNPLENRKVSTLRNFTTIQSANITATDLKALSNQHVICDTDLTIDVDDTFQDSFNVNISVEYGKTVTINATSPATINNSTLTQGVYFLSKVKGTNNFKIKVIRRDFEILQHTGNTFDVDTKAGKIFYEKYGSYFSNPKGENPIKLNIGEPGSWAIINSNTTAEPSIVNNTDSRPIRYLAGGNQWSEDELSDSTIDIVIQVLPFEIRVSYKLIST